MFTKRKEKMFMNLQESDILRIPCYEPFINQRILAEISGHSQGVVNRCIKSLIKSGCLDGTFKFLENCNNVYSNYV